MPAPRTVAPQRHRAATCVIAAFLALQFIAGFKLLCPPRSIPALNFMRVACAPKLWPFLSYNMYNAAHFPGTTLVDFHVVAMRRDGTEFELTRESLGVDQRVFRQELVQALLKSQTAVMQSFLDRHQGRQRSRQPDRRRGQGRAEDVMRLRQVRLEDRSWVLQDDGSIARGEVHVYRRFAVDREGRVQ